MSFSKVIQGCSQIPGSKIFSLPPTGICTSRTIKNPIFYTFNVFSSEKLPPSCSDGLICLCVWWKIFAIIFLIRNRGSPNKPLSGCFPTTCGAANFGTWLSSCQRDSFLKEFTIVAMPLLKSELHAFTHPAGLPVNFKQPRKKNVLFIISQLSVVYIVTKDNKFVTKHQIRCCVCFFLIR